MAINLTGSLAITGSLVVNGGITMSGSIASASYASNADLLDGRDSLTFANTGSNTFTNTQYISATNNPVSFTSTASLYSDGGMRLTKDLYVSGTSYFNNVTVFGTQSVSYITSSQLNISTNLISVNTDTPSIRFGGLAVYDSGSTGLSGSLLWDSEDNHWVYSNPSGSTYDGGMLISGPRNTSGLGNEVGTTACALMMGQGGDHITSSAIFSYGNATCFYGTSFISSSGGAYFASCVGIGTSSPASPLHLVTSGLPAIRLTLGSEARCHNINGVNLGRDLQVLPFRHFSVQAGNGIAEGQIVMNAYEDFIVGTGASYTPRLTITPTGIACFACQVCAPTLLASYGFYTTQICSTGNSNTFGAAGSPGRAVVIQASCVNQAIQFKNCSGGDGTLYATGTSTTMNYVFNTYSTGDAFAITNNGYVGIGTSSPSYFLDLAAGTAGNFSTPALRVSTSTGGAGGATMLQLNHTANSVSGLQIIQYGATPGNGASIFNTENSYLNFGTNNTERMRITSGGDVYIGTTNCIAGSGYSNRLSIKATALNTWGVAEIRGYDSSNGGEVHLGGGDTTYVTLVGERSGVGCSAFYLRTKIGAANEVTNKLVITNTGVACFACQICAPSALITNNIIIGTTYGTTAQFSFGSTTGAQTTANLTDAGVRCGILEVLATGGAAGNGSALMLGSDTWGTGAGKGQIALKALLTNGSGCGTSDLAFSLRNDPSCSNLTERMRITSGGNVLINCSLSEYGKLQVSTTPSTAGAYASALGLGFLANACEGASTGISFYTKVSLDSGIWENARISAFTDAVTSSAYGALAFYTMNATTLTERMRIGNNGYVGIGVTSPGYKLDVYDSSGATTLRLQNLYTVSTGGLYGYSRIIGLTGGNGLFLSQNVNCVGGGASPLDDSTQPGHAISIGQNYGGIAFMRYAAGAGTISPVVSMFINNSNNVGIGTTNPSTKLHLCDNSADGLVLNLQNGTAGGGTVNIQSYSDSLYLNSDGAMVFRTNLSTSITERMRITSTGIACFACAICAPLFVGVGNNAYIFNSAGATTGYQAAAMSNTGGAINWGIANSSGVFWGSGGGGAYYGTIGTTNATDFVIATDNAGRMIINSTGNVGIGTTNPSQKLEVVGGEIKAGRVDSSNEGGQVSFGRASDNATGWYIDVYGSTSTPTLRFVDVSNSAVRMTMDGSGVTCFAGVVCAPFLALTATTGVTPLQAAQNQSCGGYLRVEGDHRITGGGVSMFEYVGTVPAGGNACVLVIPVRSQGNLHTRSTFEIHGVSAEYNLNGLTGAFGGVIAIESLNNINVIQGFNLYGTLCGVASSCNCIRLSFNRQYTAGSGVGCGVSVRIKLLTTLAWDNYFNIMSMQ